MKFVFEPPAPVALSFVDSDLLFPITRIFCVGRNYVAHALELGNAVDRDAPIWFTKSASAFCPSGSTIPYPPGTSNLHFEMELVIAIGRDGFRVSEGSARALICGYACGLDLTRRDLQDAAKAKGYPWDTGKDFENAAVIGDLTPASQFSPGNQPIVLSQNGVLRQNGSLAKMLWSIPELIADLSQMYHLSAGDVIFTGTPSGVGPISVGDRLEGAIPGLSPLELTVS
jgi:fumarylpyruvate hydrolase